MRFAYTTAIVALCGAAAAIAQTRPTTMRGPQRWEKQVAEYEQGDRENPPPKGAALFIGSSTIRLWKSLESDFAGHKVINRGFGGTEIADATHFADRLIVPHAPEMVFLRAGGNDIHNGKTAKQVFEDFKQFVETVHAKLPETTIVFISLSPAPARWEERDANKQLNELVAEYVKRRPLLRYVETYDMTITPDGQPREELFVKDRLHLNEDGYKLLAERVRPFLGDTDPKVINTRVGISTLEVALDVFEIDHGRYPSSEEGLQALVTKPAALPKWQGPYLKQMPTDPWGRPFVYRSPGKRDPPAYDLLSVGPDGKEGGADDIDNWTQR